MPCFWFHWKNPKSAEKEGADFRVNRAGRCRITRVEQTSARPQGRAVDEPKPSGLPGSMQQLPMRRLGEGQVRHHVLCRFLGQQQRSGLNDIPVFHPKDLL